MNKYYLTFDVGIKNLSYCISCFDNDNNINILHWGLLDNSIHYPQCQYIKGNRRCTQDSAFYAKDINEFVCKKHNDSNHKRVNIKTIDQYNDTFDKQMKRIFISLDNLYTNMITKNYDIDNRISNLEIIIENQPVLTNPIMKTISTAIYFYFLYKQIHVESCKNATCPCGNNPNLISSVKFLSATVKTSDLFINFLKLEKNITSTFDIKDYATRKKFTIDVTHKYLLLLPKTIHNTHAISKFLLESKKDDMADSFLYVIYSHYKNFMIKNKTKFSKDKIKKINNKK